MNLCARCHAAERMKNRSICSPCRNEQINKWRSLNTDRVWDRRIKRKYGISHDEWQAMMAKQDGKCAICGLRSDRKLCVDHCHQSGSVRQLLCHHCNRGIGSFSDKPELLYSAIRYIKKHKQA